MPSSLPSHLTRTGGALKTPPAIPRIAAVLPAGGSGQRMNSPLPKQFLDLCGKPVLLRTLERVLELDGVSLAVVVVPQAHLSAARALLADREFPVPVLCVRGGKTRQDSVRRGVIAARGRFDILLVHDAVRPLCDLATMRRVVDAAMAKGGAVPGLPATETIQRVSGSGRVLKTPPREQLFSIQTPQCFRADILRTALDRAHREGFVGTDESSVARWAGHPVYVVEGSPDNLKITRPQDLELAGWLLKEHEKGNP
jgi:2-C-methyl-D-erythritol 4-phosphate cytidylyltransferase